MACAPCSPRATSVALARPDDFHHHLRDGGFLPHLVNAAARQFNRVLVMPNLRPPVTTVELATAYRERIMGCLEDAEAMTARGFLPLMTLYLTDNTTPEDIAKAKASGIIYACKLYPAGATTNSDSGVTDLPALLPTLKAMAEHGLLLLVHGEVTDFDVDFFDREKVFIERHMTMLVKECPDLKMVMEHVTTADAVEFVKSCPPNVAATITPQHLLYSRNSLFDKGIRPHMFCLPILKREEHRLALIEAISSGNPKFFLGTDSAPHEMG